MKVSPEQVSADAVQVVVDGLPVGLHAVPLAQDGVYEVHVSPLHELAEVGQSLTLDVLPQPLPAEQVGV